MRRFKMIYPTVERRPKPKFIVLEAVRIKANKQREIENKLADIELEKLKRGDVA